MRTRSESGPWSSGGHPGPHPGPVCLTGLHSDRVSLSLRSSAALCHGGPCREPPRPGRGSLAIHVPGSPSLPYWNLLFSPSPPGQHLCWGLSGGCCCAQNPNPDSGHSVPVHGPEPRPCLDPRLRPTQVPSPGSATSLLWDLGKIHLSELSCLTCELRTIKACALWGGGQTYTEVMVQPLALQSSRNTPLMRAVIITAVAIVVSGLGNFSGLGARQ